MDRVAIKCVTSNTHTPIACVRSCASFPSRVLVFPRRVAHCTPLEAGLLPVRGASFLFKMKKVSTGERIKFADLRRRSVGVSRDADSDAAQSEQRFVSELMDTTPSSSYEGETLRDGYAYNPPDPSVSDSPLARYESDGEAADEVVTDTQEGIGKADLIVKEDVPEVGSSLQ